MSQQSNQEKTEKATPKHKRDSKKKGQIPKSKEVASFIILLFCAGYFFTMGDSFYHQLKHIITSTLTLDGKQAYDLETVLNKSKNSIADAFSMLIPFFTLLVAASYFSNIIIGGSSFTLEKLKPKLSNISPFSGIKRLFSIKSFTTLLQSIAKCLLIFSVTYFSLKSIYPVFIEITNLPLQTAMYFFSSKVLLVFLLIASSTIIIAGIDLPVQLHQHNKTLKMTKQEVKEEYKQSEGDPKIKGKLRQLQREMARRKTAIKNLPEATVVIVNPTHFSIALKYEPDTMDAPVILTMGSEKLALHIRRLSTEYGIPILEIPILARVLYSHGEIGSKIPTELFQAVAQVIAYVFKLDDPMQHHLDPFWVDELPIPEDLIDASESQLG